MQIFIAILTSMLQQLDSEDFKDIVDTIIDKLEVIAHQRDDWKGQTLLIGCETLRRVLDVPDDDADQMNPQ